MGSVWLAERADGLFSRRVALKLVHRSLEAAATERFARERQILAGLDHPHIARLLDAGFTGDGQPYLALWQASVARDNAVAAQREATKAKVVQASSSIFSA
jgi:serine/threonine protein kinase